MSVSEIQALWFDATEWSEADAVAWADEHDFKSDTVRTRISDDDGSVTHFILAQFETPSDAEWVTLADDFPLGVSASAVITNEEGKTMPEKQISKAGTQSGDNPLTFVMSSEAPDREKDVIRQKGIDLRNFRKNNICLFGHDHSLPIGTWENVRVEGTKLLGDLKLAAKGTSAFIDTLHGLVEQKILKACSVGFSVSDYSFRDEKAGFSGGIDFKKTELLETSLCSVPANSEALSIAKSFGADPRKLFTAESLTGSKMRAQFETKAPAPKPDTLLAIPKSNHSINGDIPMSVAEKIKAKQARLVAIKDRITEIKALVEVEGDYELTADDQTEIDTLSDEQVSTTKSLETLQKMESVLASKSAPASGIVAGTPAGLVPATAAKKAAGGELFIKTIAASIIAKMSDQPVADIIDQMYADDDRVKAVSKKFLGHKTAVGIADSTTPTWAVELVRTDIQAFLEELAPVSVYAALASQGQSLDFGGNSSVTIPRRNRAAQSGGAATGLAAAGALGNQIGGSFVGEGGVIPVKNMALASSVLNRYKMAVISAFTNELMEMSIPNIEAVVRAAIIEDTAMALDGALLDAGAAVAGVRPASIFSGAGTASAGATAVNIISDIKVLLGAMSAINGSKPVLIMNSNRLLGLSTITTAAGGFMFRDELAAGRLLGVPVISSVNVNPAGVGIVDANSFVGANDAPMFSVSDQATLTMANADGTAPTQADDGAGALGNAEQVQPDGGLIVAGDGTPVGAAGAGYQAMSMFQQYSTSVRMVLPTSWGLTRAGATAHLSGVAW